MKWTLKNGLVLVQLVEPDILVVNRANINMQLPTNLTAPNLLPYFNADGCYLHTLIAIAPERVGDKSFYAGMKETASHNIQASICNDTDLVEMTDNGSNNTMGVDTTGNQTTNNTIYDEGEQNIDLMLNIMDERDKLKQDVLTKKFFTVYMDTVTNTEPAVSATPKLASL